MHTGFFFLYRLGILKNDERYKFHYAVKYLVQPDDHVVDLGANLGYFARNFSDIAPQGNVTCIEPIPAFYSVLQDKIGGRKNVELLHTALGSENGEITMVLPKSNGMIRTGLPHVPKEGENIENEEKATVKLTSARELFASFSRIDYLKCDIEGFEWVVFQEIKETLAEKKPTIQVEIGEENIGNMHQLLTEIGYVQYGIAGFKVIKDQLPQSELGDFLYIHSSKEQQLTDRWKKLGKMNEL